jgi:hypothetical protein
MGSMKGMLESCGGVHFRDIIMNYTVCGIESMAGISV